MNSPSPHSAADFALLPTETIENLVSDHFEKVFAFFNMFFQDHRLAIFYAEKAFLAAKDAGDDNLQALYQWVVDRVCVPSQAILPGGLSQNVAACFMLKELGRFRYHEIAQMMGLAAEEVKHNVARTRQALMAEMA